MSKSNIDADTILDKVQRGEFPFPRQIHSDIPPALEAICLKAMAVNPEDRFDSVGALSDDVEHGLPLGFLVKLLLLPIGRDEHFQVLHLCAHRVLHVVNTHFG